MSSKPSLYPSGSKEWTKLKWGFCWLHREEKRMRDKVVIVGSGLMGSGIAACCALAGNPVILTDLDLEAADRGRQSACGNMQELLDNGLASEENVKKAVSLLEIDTDYAQYRDNAFLVIEAIYENLEAKQKLFKEMDQVFPAEVLLLSNTSGFRITDISRYMVHPERAVTAHFWFPAHLVPLVEVVAGDRTDMQKAVLVKQILTGWGKAAVLVKKGLPGQLANRILQAVIREAVNIVEIGLAEPEDIDMAVKMGMGIRMPVWGPLEHIEAVGLDLCRNVQETVLPEISNRTKPSPLFDELIGSGRLGYKPGKGFYDWTIKDMDALAKKRSDFIIYARKFMDGCKTG